MKLTFAELSSVGPVRHQNEDCIGFWQPDDENDRLLHGAIAAIADGVGGLSSGDIASRMAVDIALNTFKAAPKGGKATPILTQIFNEANLDIYNFGMQAEQRRMATTLSVCVFRNKEAAIGHVGDTRIYLVRNGQIKRLTSDHTYVEMQLKLGLISQEEAMDSELRSILTRTLGQNPVVQADFSRTVLYNGDRIVLCSDGLHASMMEHEICDTVTRLSPADACEYFISTAENRGAEDNISVQVVRVDEVRQTSFYKGLSYGVVGPKKVQEWNPPLGTEIHERQVRDGRFEIIDIIHQSGMRTVFKATYQTTG